ncbi:threonine--tRNA ligase [Limisalsivibrio acetivorans]|uniref:threonine--tRNA ligase n=1 Tax=Limisalsivibrio acetivorans TaxID=1304888 RepID=UPI0009DC3D08|nr:threonine--tRNA ligase [Limisalsivibrio acetivorans]
MNIILADGSNREIANGSSAYDVAADISPKLAKKSVAAEINGKLTDLRTELNEGDKLRLVTEDDPEAIEILRHSTAHVMAQAVQRLYDDVKVTIGPVVKDGFYYDFDTGDRKFTPEDLEKIEKEMKKIAQEKIPVQREVLEKDDAVEKFRDMGEDYKVELIEEIEDPTVSLYGQGDFTDLCRGPHVDNTSRIKHFKLLSVAGAYWRGDEKNKMLQRVYGTSWFKKDELENYLTMLEEARKRDHRKLGRQLKLFMMDDEVGAGFPIYLPNGGVLRSTLEDFERKEHLKRGYDIVYGPNILKQDMWKRSGHYDNYRENMYFTEIDETEFGIKPMNCLSHMMTFKSELRSYRDLPQKYFELGTVHRHEKSGVLHGLMRVRAFTQDDAHIFCRPDQLEDEIIKIIDFVDEVMNIFGFEFELEISTRPEKFIGSIDNWDKATDALKQALDKKGLPYEINEGDGAFYGPKIDIKLKDAIGRFWQCATIQADFNLPERFDINYIGEDGDKHRPVMLHRVILGSVDRFIGILIEHFAGSFPIWIAPVQVKVMSITDDALEHAKEIENSLRAEGFRVQGDYRNEKINLKIREAQLEKVPHMIVLGKKEVEENKISVRLRDGSNKNNLDLSTYIDVLKGLNEIKSLELWR